MSKGVLIALCSDAMGAGKSVVAQQLVIQHQFVLVKFAGPLKAMTRALLTDAGYNEHDMLARVEGTLKEAVLPEFGVSTRHIMQTLGSEWGRECIDHDLWVNITRWKVHKLLGLGCNVVIDDMRFPNEYRMVRALGGHCYRVNRPGIYVTRRHDSEGRLSDLSLPEIMNTGTVGDLRLATNRMIESISS